MNIKYKYQHPALKEHKNISDWAVRKLYFQGSNIFYRYCVDLSDRKTYAWESWKGRRSATKKMQIDYLKLSQLFKYLIICY